MACSCAMMRFSSLRGSPMSARPLGPLGSWTAPRVEGIARHGARPGAGGSRLLRTCRAGRPARVRTGCPGRNGACGNPPALELRRGQRLAQVGDGVEGEVMVGELSEVGVGRRYGQGSPRIRLGLSAPTRSAGAVIASASSSRSCLVEPRARQVREQPGEAARHHLVERIACLTRSHHLPCGINMSRPGGARPRTACGRSVLPFPGHRPVGVVDCPRRLH